MTSNETGPFSIFWIKNREVLKFINILPCFHNALLSESYIFSSLSTRTFLCEPGEIQSFWFRTRM
jgi:hypothetical protein